MTQTARSLLLLVLAGVLAFSAPKAKATYPERPITLIVAYGTASSIDVTARMLAPFIEKSLGNDARLVVTNRPGAGGEIGFAAIADAPPDGYTLGFINTPNVVTIPIERQARYALDRLDPLVNIIDDPGAIAVHSDAGFWTLDDLVAYARTNPQSVTVGSTGVGSDDHLALLLLQRQAQVQFTHVPFPGGSENYRALLEHHIAVSALNIGEAIGHRQSDPVRILGQMSKARWEQAADVPTFEEQGYAITLAALRGLAAPKGLPADIRAKLVDAILAAANNPEFQAKARETFQPLRILDAASYARELSRMDEDFRGLWNESPWLR